MTDVVGALREDLKKRFSDDREHCISFPGSVGSQKTREVEIRIDQSFFLKIALEHGLIAMLLAEESQAGSFGSKAQTSN